MNTQKKINTNYSRCFDRYRTVDIWSSVIGEIIVCWRYWALSNRAVNFCFSDCFCNCLHFGCKTFREIWQECLFQNLNNLFFYTCFLLCNFLAAWICYGIKAAGYFFYSWCYANNFCFSLCCVSFNIQSVINCGWRWFRRNKTNFDKCCIFSSYARRCYYFIENI